MKAYYSDNILVEMTKLELAELLSAVNAAELYRAFKYGENEPYTKKTSELWLKLYKIEKDMPF